MSDFYDVIFLSDSNSRRRKCRPKKNAVTFFQIVPGLNLLYDSSVFVANLEENRVEISRNNVSGGAFLTAIFCEYGGDS